MHRANAFKIIFLEYRQDGGKFLGTVVFGRAQLLWVFFGDHLLTGRRWRTNLVEDATDHFPMMDATE